MCTKKQEGKEKAMGMIDLMRETFAPAPHVARVPEEQIPGRYTRLRYQILASTFFGYAVFYIVRNNLPPVAKEMGAALSYDKSMIGTILASTSLAYGIGKFVMGAFSDRSNPRRFMPFALVLTAVLNFLFAFSTSYPMHLFLWSLNGFVQGGGWGPCGRSMGHWFSLRERGAVFAFWNISHNLGGAIAGILTAYAASHLGWASAFYVPGILALVSAVILAWGLVDTPQSEGLPPIEEYKNDHPEHEEDHEVELSTKDLFLNYIVTNKYLWLFAFANFFVYITRYAMLTWGPTYLKEVKGASLLGGGSSTMLLELAGIPSTLFIGWLSDKCSGRRGMVSLLCMVPIFFAFGGLLLNPPGRLWLDMVLLGVIGFFVYPPVMLLGVAALDLTSKKAVGTAAGFVGLFGSLGTMVQAQGIGWLAQNYGWPSVFYAILGCTVMAIVILAFTWNIKPRA
jgi:OPA family glycerol-3-phosphate transporter-like MFS transporter